MTYELTMDDLATPTLRRRIDLLSPQRFAAAVGVSVYKLFRAHFRALGPNKKGWPSTGFWRDAANATNWQAVAGGVKISIAKIGVRQRLQGGEIHPVNAQALTIPISTEAYGHTAADFPGAFLLKTKKGAYIVQYTSGKGKHAIFNFLFKLVQSVDQEPDPNVIPSSEETLDTAAKAVIRSITGDLRE